MKTSSFQGIRYIGRTKRGENVVIVVIVVRLFTVISFITLIDVIKPSTSGCHLSCVSLLLTFLEEMHVHIDSAKHLHGEAVISYVGMSLTDRKDSGLDDR